MSLPEMGPVSEPGTQHPPLSEAEYQQLRQDVAQQLRKELRRSGRQHYFAMGMHALMLVFLAVILFLSSQRYHDFMLWAVGLCLLLFGALEFLDLDYIYAGHSWLDIFARRGGSDEAP